jgi:ATP-dependent Clp protease ATP-binding subunit ClpC
MNGYNFTERVRKVLSSARAEAERRGHASMTPEHIALALIQEGQGVAYAILQNSGIAADEVRTALESQLPAAAPMHEPGSEIAFTAIAKKVLEQALAEARELRHSYVGTEHLLLALLHSVAGSTGAPFHKRGLTREKARVTTLQLLGPTPPPWP